MKQLILTGVSNEVRLGTNVQRFMLVFNEGELSIEVSNKALNRVLEFAHANGDEFTNGAAYSEEPQPPQEQQEPTLGDVPNLYAGDDDVGVDQV